MSGGLYDFEHAAAVGNGVWWAVDWTQGAREMINKYLGTASAGNGKVAVIGAEYDFSVSPILWAKARNPPRRFNGQAPDLRVAIAAMLVRTIATDNRLYKNATGYFVGLDTEYRMTSKFSVTFQAYGESRDSTSDAGASTASIPACVPHRLAHHRPHPADLQPALTTAAPSDNNWAQPSTAT